MSKQLTQSQRLIVSVIYIIIIFVIFILLGGDISKLLNAKEDISLWLYSGVLLILLGSYVTEPFFTKPTDSIANSMSAFLALIAFSDKSKLIAYNFILYYIIVIFVFSIITILVKDKARKISRLFFCFTTRVGSAKVMFSIIYIASSYSFFSETNLRLFVLTLAILICILFFDIIGKVVKLICDLITLTKVKPNNVVIGNAIECKDGDYYSIKIKGNSLKVGYGDIVAVYIEKRYFCISLVTEIKQLLDSIRIEVKILKNEGNEVVCVDINECGYSNGKSIFLNRLDAILLDKEKMSRDIEPLLSSCYVYSNQKEYIGCVEKGSDINTINFSIHNTKVKIREGLIIKSKIDGRDTLFQVFNGMTKDKSIDKCNSQGCIIGSARKIGYYNSEDEELKYIKWVPNTFEPVYNFGSCQISDEELALIANNAIGRLPETNIKIPIKDINSLVTHSTAILGILGIGKSCLTFELIKKIVSRDIKVICIDITNQYIEKLGLYVQGELIRDDLNVANLASLERTSSDTGDDRIPSEWGNLNNYREIIESEISSFMESDFKISVINPENHKVKKAVGTFNIREAADVTTVEKTKIISEALLEYFKDQGESEEAECLLVFEEAHSLIPEWNSVTQEGDKNAVNGIAKVIMQGRKYGLGCCVVTQRTANVTKSILNQCNTTFAMRIFDDTGKSFLENYIGKDYASMLPSLEERYAIAFGKGLQLKQPVIIQLNDRDIFRTREQEAENE